jgi:hypothetical protein
MAIRGWHAVFAFPLGKASRELMLFIFLTPGKLSLINSY